MAKITYETNDQATRLFLSRYGVPRELIDRGSVTTEELQALGLDSVVLEDLAQYQDGNSTDLSPAEAMIGYQHAVAMDARKFQALIRLDHLPNGNAARTLWSHLIGTHQVNLWDIEPEASSCQEIQDQGFSLEEMRGLFFIAEKVPEFWQEKGRAVVPVLLDGLVRATGTIVSRKGHVLTAAHVLMKSGTTQVESNAAVVFDATTYGVRRENIVVIDEPSDLAVLYLPDLASPSLPHAKLADSSFTSGPVMLMGYPETTVSGDPKIFTTGGIQGESCGARSQVSGLKRKPITGTGRLSCFLQSRPLHIFVDNNVESAPGFSGGPHFNEQGELIAVHSHPGYASSVVGDGVPGSLLSKALMEIRSSQE